MTAESETAYSMGDTHKLSELRIVLMGYKGAVKSSSGNIILNTEEFDQCVKRQREVADRHITVIEAPGWWLTTAVDQSSELLKQEILLSVSLCPAEPHIVLMVIRFDNRLIRDERKVLQGFVDLLSERVWSHTIVLFTFGDFLGDTSIEQHIEREGEDLQWLVEKCGNRYHVLNNKNRTDDAQIKDFLEYAEVCRFLINRTILQVIREFWKKEKREKNRKKREKKKEETIHLQMCGFFFPEFNDPRPNQRIRKSDTEKISELRIVLMGYKCAGKSSSGNIILNREEFDLKRTAQCVKRQREVADRHITVIEAPGWWSTVPVDQSSELLKQEILLSVSLCPPGPHVVLLVIRVDNRFKRNDREVHQGYVEFLGERVWSHTMVLFTHGDFLGDTSIEQHIESEGEDLQWLVEKCGNRYHVLNNKNRSDDTQIKDLLDNIEGTVTDNNNSHFEMDRMVLQMMTNRKRAAEGRAKNRMKRMNEQRQIIRSQMSDTPKLSKLRIVLMGCKGAGKSSAGNIILNREEFDLKTTIQCVKRQREVADRHITVIEAPGWWNDEPIELSPKLLKQQILISVSLCPPGPHTVLLVVRVDTRFQDAERKVFQGYVDLLSERVWRHTIVLFTHGDFLGDTSIEQHIEREGEDLQWLVEKCGNRYHVFNNKNRTWNTQLKDLLEKIEETVTENNSCHFETERRILLKMEDRKSPADKIIAKGRGWKLWTQYLRSETNDTQTLSKLRILLMGCKYAGKSSAGNIILNREEFDLKRTVQCVKRQREVADRHITVIEAPGWLRNVHVDESCELLKQEILFSVSLCPPGPHVVLLVIPVGNRFKRNDREVLQGYVDLLSERVWSHTIVLFTHGDFLGDTSIEQHIETEGEHLQWLVEKCGNRYHVLNNKNRSDDTQIKDLLEKIEKTVTQNNGCHFETTGKILQEVKDRKRAYDIRAKKRIKRMQTEREIVRVQTNDTQKLSELRIVLMGYKCAGKSSSGNIILNREEFDLKTTDQCVKRQREVADRHITVIEAPGWWRSVPVDQSSELLKQEILLSVSLCPPGPHVVLLVICADIIFKEEERKVFQGYVDLLSERVWSHTIVLFTHGDFLGDTSIEQHIESEGEDLQWLVEKCGNRYHVLNNKNRSNDTQIKDLLEKIEETVTQNNGCHFEIDRKILQELEEKRRAEEEGARSKIMSEDEMSDTASLGSFDYGSFRSLSVSGENISDTVSLRTSGYGSFRSQLDNSSIFASSDSIERPISFGNGSKYNRVIGQKFVSEDKMSDPASLRSSVSGSFRSRSDADMFASSRSTDKPISFKSGSVNPTSESLEHSGKEAQRTDP